MSGTFSKERLYRLLFAVSVLGLSSCAPQADEEIGITQQPIVDVAHTAVERQSIGNCWIYSHATWIESMYLSSTGTEIDLSQTYWTYWHWFEQITGSLSRREGGVEVATGGTWSTANALVRRYGVLVEAYFVPEDVLSEMSTRQSSALSRINRSLSTGLLSTAAARSDRALVRAELDEAFRLDADVSGMLDDVFGPDVTRTFDSRGASLALAADSNIVPAAAFPVSYIRRQASWSGAESFGPVNTSLATAMSSWRTAYYSRGSRSVLQRVQRALHQRQPVILTWDVDFAAQENYRSGYRGSFNLQTLLNAGRPGTQGGHMVVLEDYEAVTTEFGLLPAGVTLDPNLPEDQAKLTAALRPDTVIKFLRIKNSWGAFRFDRASAPGFPGYHDLYMDYLDGPIAWCPDADRSTPNFECTGQTTPLRYVILPPGF
jgi:hypothetical protein